MSEEKKNLWQHTIEVGKDLYILSNAIKDQGGGQLKDSSGYDDSGHSFSLSFENYQKLSEYTKGKLLTHTTRRTDFVAIRKYIDLYELHTVLKDIIYQRYPQYIQRSQTDTYYPNLIEEKIYILDYITILDFINMKTIESVD